MDWIAARLSAMDTGDWIAVAAVIVAGVATYFAHVSAQAGRTSANAGKESARSSAKSAEEAATISLIERERRQEERERRHDELRPRLLGEIKVEKQKGTTGESLFGTIIVPDRDFRIKAEGLAGNTTTPVTPVDDPGSLIRANQPFRFHIEHWASDQREPRTKQVRFKFWPPLDADDTDPWTCPCGKATGETLDGSAHWEVRVMVVYTSPRIRTLG